MATHRGYQTWIARVKRAGVTYHLGTFRTKSEATAKEKQFMRNYDKENNGN